jgi:hypothetical protein
MNIESIGIIIASIVAIISLFFSVKNYKLNKPKLKINLTDKSCDAYYGKVCAKNDVIVNTQIGYAYINIINNSPVEIFVKDIKLKIGKDIHRLVLKNNKFWESIYFFYCNAKEEKEWDGTGINYDIEGFDLPLKISPYTIASGICLFHDFPNIQTKKQKGKIIIYSAVGKITKNIKFIRYDKDFISSEMKDVKIYMKNSK